MKKGTITFERIPYSGDDYDCHQVMITLEFDDGIKEIAFTDFELGFPVKDLTYFGTNIINACLFDDLFEHDTSLAIKYKEALLELKKKTEDLLPEQMAGITTRMRF